MVTVAEVKRNSDSWRSLAHFYSQPAMEADLEKTPPQVTILPTIHTHWGAMWWMDKKGRMLGMNSPVKMLLYYAYGGLPARMLFLAPVPAGQYDFIANLPSGSQAGFQQKIRDQFGLTAQKEVRNTQAWVLTVDDAQKLKSIVNTNGHKSREFDYGKLTMGDAKMSSLADALEGLFVLAPVIDRTGAHGRYDFTLQWNVHDTTNRVSTLANELNAVGLELTATNMPVEMVVVEKAQ